MTPSPKMQRFMRKNEASPVVRAERLTPDRRQVLSKADLEASDRCRYFFADGGQMTLRDEDARTAPGFMPAWKIEVTS